MGRAEIGIASDFFVARASASIQTDACTSEGAKLAAGFEFFPMRSSSGRIPRSVPESDWLDETRVALARVLLAL